MLKCRDIAHQASDYLDHNLTLRGRLVVGAHLLLCGKCRAFVRHMRTALAYYRELPPDVLDDAEAAAIAARASGKPDT
jgi:predicted anti-sigma-YlaC factor YlaD